MGFWAIVGLFALSMAVSYLLTPRTKYTAPKAAGIEDFNVTTSELGREFPVLFGSKKMSGPNVVWYGDLKAVVIKEKVSSGFFGSKKVPVGHKYYLGMHMVLAHDIDSITKLETDGKELWSGTSTGGTITINAPEIFGGNKSGGGVTGSVDFETGASDQDQNDYLQSVFGTDDIPAYRGVACLVLRQVYLGNSEYIKMWDIWAKKIYDDWYSAKAAIGNDMNPAHILYATYTSTKWGAMFNTADIDDANFRAVADTLYDEGFGMSLIWDHSARIEDFVESIREHIDAAIYTDIHTGLVKIRLIRADYDVETIPLLDDDNVATVEQYRRRTIEEQVNSVTVKFWDATTGETGSTTLHDIASIARQGYTNNVVLEYPGITSKALADKVAARELAARSADLATVTLLTTAEGMQIEPGMPFLWTCDQYGVTEMVLRAVRVSYGAFGDSSIRIEAVQDVFGVATAVYDSAPASLWTSPSSAPAVCPVHKAVEMPYHWMALEYGDTAVQALASTVGFAGITGAKPSTDSLDAIPCYKISTASDYTEYDAVDFSAWCQPTANIAISDTVFSVAWAGDYDNVEIGQWGIIDSEIVYVQGFTSSTVTVGRGCLDTVPAAHTTSANLFIFDDMPFSPVQYASGNTVNMKLLPRTGIGTLDIGDASAQSVTMASRLNRPYPPARLRINELQEPVEFLLGETLTITWKHRDRTAQTYLTVNTETNTDYGPEAGTTYSVSVKRSDTSEELYAVSSISGATVDVTSANIGYTGNIKVYVWSVRGGVASLQQQMREFYYVQAEE